MRRILILVGLSALLCGMLSGCCCLTTPVKNVNQKVEAPKLTIPPPTNDNTANSYELELIDENGATGETVNPATTGKITIVNFWGTWCSPCVKEMPYLEQIAEEYADDVIVVAVHSTAMCDSAPAFISENYPNSRILFAWERGEDMDGEYYLKMGGISTYPYTVILNEDGEKVRTFFSSVSYDELDRAVKEQLYR